MGIWQDRAITIQDAAEKTARTTKRALRELQISAMDTTKSENAQLKAQMFQQLAEEAAQDGDQIDAAKYMTQSNNLMSTAQTLYQNEEKQSIMTDFRKIKNAWHDGTISVDDLNTALGALDERATGIAYTEFYAIFDGFIDKVAKDLDKGVKRSEWGGLPVVKGRGKGSGSSSVLNPATGKTLEEEDEAYVDKMTEIDRQMRFRMIDPYKGQLAKVALMMERETELKDRYARIQEMDPNAKVPYQGKNQKASVVEGLLEAELFGDAREPFANKSNSPVPNVPLTEMYAAEPGMYDVISAKINELQESGQTLDQLDIMDIVNQIDGDLSGLTNKVYVYTTDAQGRKELKVIVKDGMNFIPGVTHISNGATWEEVKKSESRQFPSAEIAKAWFVEMFGREPSKKELNAKTGLLTTPDYANVDGDIWLRSEDGTWIPSDPELMSQYEQVLNSGNTEIASLLLDRTTGILPRNAIEKYYGEIADSIPVVPGQAPIQNEGQQILDQSNQINPEVRNVMSLDKSTLPVSIPRIDTTEMMSKITPTAKQEYVTDRERMNLLNQSAVSQASPQYAKSVIDEGKLYVKAPTPSYSQIMGNNQNMNVDFSGIKPLDTGVPYVTKPIVFSAPKQNPLSTSPSYSQIMGNNQGLTPQLAVPAAPAPKENLLSTIGKKISGLFPSLFKVKA
jgi:hypothetical protein